MKSFLFCIFSFFCLVLSEPVQYCKYGAEKNEIDFCMGMLLHKNVSTSSHDLYLTMTVTRPSNSALGWTALGLGETMEGALMFIVYGDPLSGEKPIVSIRKSTGHRQPTLLTQSDMNGADLRVMRADWFETSSISAVAMVSLVCYSCHLWPGTQISATSRSQPWMWAWNPSQDIGVFAYDAHLKMHAHHAGAGGWGNFYTDMPRSINTWHNQPSFPPVRPGVRMLGASDTPRFSAALLRRNPVLHLHGIAMGIAFLLLFPAGIVAMRSGKKSSFKYHWIVQAVASILVEVGCVLGLLLGRKIDTTHQVVGIMIGACLGVQGLLGWRHHVVFMRLRRRTWPSYAHIWLGRLLVVGGWANVLMGMALRGYSGLCVGAIGGLVGLEVLGLGVWLWWKSRRRAKNHDGPEDSVGQGVNYFAIGTDEDDDDNLSMDDRDEQKKPMMELEKE